jgi:hypothetical protein
MKSPPFQFEGRVDTGLGSTGGKSRVGNVVPKRCSVVHVSPYIHYDSVHKLTLFASCGSAYYVWGSTF